MFFKVSMDLVMLISNELTFCVSKLEWLLEMFIWQNMNNIQNADLQNKVDDLALECGPQ